MATTKEWRAWLAERASAVNHRFWWSRAMTLGVRVMAFQGQSVFLIRHTYRPGWYLPGGAVDRGESAEAAAIRELREEGNIHCTERPTLHSFYRNGKGLSRDHVVCYIVRQFEAGEPPAPNWEIAETGFFPVDALPPRTTRATRARIAEALQQKPTTEHW